MLLMLFVVVLMKEKRKIEKVVRTQEASTSNIKPRQTKPKSDEAKHLPLSVFWVRSPAGAAIDASAGAGAAAAAAAEAGAGAGGVGGPAAERKRI